MAELFGKATGVAGGYGGSMHLLDVERHFLGGWGIVGGQLPIAVGAALALDYREPPSVVLCQLGDGATNIGAFHESLNLAAIWNLPIVFQVDQQPLRHGHVGREASAEPELWKRAAAYRMHGERVDGNDVLAVREAAEPAAARWRARSGKPAAARDDAPTASAATRWPTPARSTAAPDEIAARARARPDHALRAPLRERGLLDDEDGQAHPHARSTRRSAPRSSEAAAAPAPDPAGLFDNVYGDPDWREQFAPHGAAAARSASGEETRSWRT